MNPALRDPVNESRLRSSPARAGIGRIEESGGRFGGGIIRGVSVIARGPAIGHDMWIDSTMLAQTADAINRAADGAKSRFTHPGISSDGMGKMTGKMFDARVDGNLVRADLHLSPSAELSPDGDLRTYILSLAENHPESFGMSIAFERDGEAMKAFRVKHTGKSGGFKSPDPMNTGNFEHARLKSLRAVDVVDEPAANPSGLFARGDADLVYAAESALDYALGLSTELPDCEAFGIHPDRIAGFMRRYLASRKLSIITRVDFNIDLAKADALPAALRESYERDETNEARARALAAAGLEVVVTAVGGA